MRLATEWKRGFQPVVLEQELEKLIGVGPLEDPAVYRAVRRRSHMIFARLWYDGAIEESNGDLTRFVFTDACDQAMLSRERLKRRFEAPPHVAMSTTVAQSELCEAMRREHRWRRRRT